MFDTFIFFLFLFYILYRLYPRFKRLNDFHVHMLGQISSKIVDRLSRTNTSPEQEQIQRGLILMREKFPDGIPEDVQKMLECLVQLAFNFGGPALLFKITNEYELVDKTRVYDQLIRLIRTLGTEHEFDVAVSTIKDQGQKMKVAWPNI